MFSKPTNCCVGSHELANEVVRDIEKEKKLGVHAATFQVVPEAILGYVS